MKEEYDSLIENKTWTIEKLPPDRKAIGCKWTYKVKEKSDGTIDRYKARLVAKGYSQLNGIDYDETFSPVVKFETLRYLLCFASANNYEIHQMDVTTAFLNGNLSEEIFMKQPEGFVIKDKEDHVCKLKKSLYGLKHGTNCLTVILNR